jgi:hypothetical protein
VHIAEALIYRRVSPAAEGASSFGAGLGEGVLNGYRS